MVGIVPNKFRVLNAKQFVEMFTESTPTIMYAFIARPLTWPDDASPPTPDATVEYLTYDVWRNMLAMKRVNASDISHVVPRHDWTSGTAYGEYRSNDATLFNNNFFVMNEAFNVYKCLSNFGGANSTSQPTSTANTAFDTADGYRWKYMYAVSAAKAVKFLSINYVPVQTLSVDDGSLQWDVQQTAANGAIETYDVVSGGSSYPYRAAIAQAGNTSTITLDASASGTNDYYNGCAVYISAGTGSGQIRTISDYDGSTKVASVSSVFATPPDNTSTFIVSPKITNAGDGAGAEAYAIVSGGAITRVVPIDTGNNYSYVTTTVTANTGSGANVVGMVAPYGGHGSDAITELGGRYVMASVRFSGSESNTFPYDNDFRAIGLMVNPVFSANGSSANGASYDMTTVLSTTLVSGTFVKDETVTGGTSNATATIVQIHDTDALRVTGITGTFSNTEVITGGTSGATATISGITSPPIRLFAGDIIYVDHRAPVVRDADQIETVRIVAQF